MRDYADMVKIHYKYYENKIPPRLRATQKKPLNDYKKHIPKNLVELDKYSDIDSMVFENKKNNELVVAMRGLDFKTQRDQQIGAEIFISDAYEQTGSDFDSSTKKRKGISLIPNKYGEILIKEQSKLDELKKEYPNKKIVLAGHSRGGRKVIDLGEHNQLEYHAFAPAEMNIYGQALLGFVSGELMPTGKAFTGNIEKEMLDMADSQKKGFMYELLYEFGDYPEIQRNIMKSSIDSKDMTSSVESFMSKMLIPRVVDRSVDMLYGRNPFRKPSDIKEMRREILERDLKRQGFPENFRLPEVGDSGLQTPDKFRPITKLKEPALTYLADAGKDKRKPPTDSIANIYRTDTDIVSRNYEATEVVDTRKEAIDIVDRLFRYHTIDHFTSDKMFESTTRDEPIDQPVDQPVQQEEAVMIAEPSQERIYPNVSKRYEVNNFELCRKYPNYSLSCKYILR